MYIMRMKANTMTSIDVELKKEAQKRGFNFSGILEQALREKLKDSSFLSPEEKERLSLLEDKERERQEQYEKKMDYLNNIKATCELLDRVEGLENKESWTRSLIPKDMTQLEDENVKLWNNFLEEIRARGIRIGLYELKKYHQWLNFGEIGLKMKEDGSE